MPPIMSSIGVFCARRRIPESTFDDDDDDLCDGVCVSLSVVANCGVF